jgi:hypothetical protein
LADRRHVYAAGKGLPSLKCAEFPEGDHG